MATLESVHYLTRDAREITFRNLVPEDAGSFLEFRKKIPGESTNTMQYVGMSFPSVEETAESFRNQLAPPTVLNLGAFDGNRVIGYLSFRNPRPGHPWVMHLGEFGMMILKDYWGCGIGRKMLELQEAYARSIGVTRIEAMVRANNDRGVKLYLNSGFKIEGTRRKGALIEGQFHDEYYIAKLLDE